MNHFAVKLFPAHLMPKLSIQPQAWLSFKRPLVRDLAYTIACPPVITSWPADLYSADVDLTDNAFWKHHFLTYLPKLHALENNPKPLNRFIGQHLNSFRLGFRFEALMLFWLMDSAYHDYELIAHNVQIFSKTNPNQTLGEVDFLVKNTQTNYVEHWELAVKFFLGEPPYSPPHWKGLKGSDNLAHKVAHMQKKSFRFKKVTVDGQDIHINKRVAIIKGRFFEPLHDTNYKKPKWLNHDLPMGRWLNHVPNNFNEHDWRNGERVEWFTKRDIYDTFHLGNHPKQSQDIIHQFHGRRNPLVWRSGLFFDLSQPVGKQAVMLRCHTD